MAPANAQCMKKKFFEGFWCCHTMQSITAELMHRWREQVSKPHNRLQTDIMYSCHKCCILQAIIAELDALAATCAV